MGKFKKFYFIYNVNLSNLFRQLTIGVGSAVDKLDVHGPQE